jgi:Sulfotransferase family
LTETPRLRPEPTLSTRPLVVSRAGRIVRSRRTRRRLASADEYPALPPRLSDDGTGGPSSPPVFVLSAGWRSGSTALQRLIISGGAAFIWGEPYPTSRLLPRLQRIAVEVGIIDGQPDRVLSGADLSAEMSDSWIATTNPPASAVMGGIRAMLQETYWDPLRETSFTSWGAKEVAATPEQIRLLAHAFPEAHFVCVVRKPTSAYRSFRRFVVSGVTTRPGGAARLRWVKGPVGYAENWVRMARAFRGFEEDPRFHLFRHEDITGDLAFAERLGGLLGIELSSAAWSIRVGETRKTAPGVLERAELAVVARLCRDEATRWEYQI